MPVLTPLEIAREACAQVADEAGEHYTALCYRNGTFDNGTGGFVRKAERAAQLATDQAARIAEWWNGETRDGDTVHIAMAIRGELGDVLADSVGERAQAAAIAAGHAETIAGVRP